jgi:diguanylate cyclase (GGDEF)-like protein
MCNTRVTTVLILAEPAVACRWEEILRSPETRVWLGRSAIPTGEHPQVILAGSLAPTVAPREEQGVIRVGGDGPADVCLAANCTDEELRLTCRLLGEVVRLRRLQRQSAETHRALALAALTDPLTGLANRRAWDQELARRLTDTASGRQLCLAVLDLDQFKEINDRQGHAAGDRVLQAVSNSLTKHLRHGDFVARLGGDEFGLLLSVPGAAEAAAIVERVRSHVAEAAAAQGTATLTASAGFAVSGEHLEVDASESLFLAADAALIAAKRAGGNRMAST